jgi:hypothetical protein
MTTLAKDKEKKSGTDEPASYPAPNIRASSAD